MTVFLIVLLVIYFLKYFTYKTALKALGIYLKEKGYSTPTDDERKKCSEIALKQTFKVWAK